MFYPNKHRSKNKKEYNPERQLILLDPLFLLFEFWGGLHQLQPLQARLCPLAVVKAFVFLGTILVSCRLLLSVTSVMMAKPPKKTTAPSRLSCLGLRLRFHHQLLPSLIHTLGIRFQSSSLTSHSDCQVAKRPREPKPCSNLNVFLSFREMEIKTAMVIEMDGPEGKGACWQGWLSEFNPRDPHVGKRELTLTVFWSPFPLNKISRCKKVVKNQSIAFECNGAISMFYERSILQNTFYVDFFPEYFLW